MATKWIESLKNAKKTCLVQDDKRKVHYIFEDGTEMAEDYALKSNELQVRKWKKQGVIGGEGSWVLEVGEQVATPRRLENEAITESYSNPVCIRKDTKACFQWRIRNLPYPKDNYSVTADCDSRQIVVKTNNKKYYKMIDVPDLVRAELPICQLQISVAHANNTLIISYTKPLEIIEMEKLVQRELEKLEACQEGAMDCSPS